MNEQTFESDRDFAAEARLDRIAAEVADRYRLLTRKWEYAGDRDETLRDVSWHASQRYGLSVEERQYVRDALGDLAPPARQPDPTFAHGETVVYVGPTEPDLDLDTGQECVVFGDYPPAPVKGVIGPRREVAIRVADPEDKFGGVASLPVKWFRKRTSP